MANFNLPTNLSEYDDIWDLVDDIIDTVVTWFDGTSDSNIPDKAKRYNTSTNKFQVYATSGSTWSNLPFHTAIDNHIADTSIHQPVQTGAVMAYVGSAAPTGYLLCDGTAVNRTTYAALFAICGTSFGAGNGSTTFNLPDLRQRFPMGKAASGTGSTLGGTGGTVDHRHTVPNHSHSIGTHTHTMGSHTHTSAAHTHTIATHTHTIPGHYHNVGASGADIAILSSGFHVHNYGKRASAGTNSGDNRVSMSGVAGATDSNTTSSDTLSNHTHDHSSFTGRVGFVSGGVNGDGNYTSGGTGGQTTDSTTPGATGGPSTNTTDASASLSTATDGSVLTNADAAMNPPFQVLNFIVKT